MFMKSEMQFNKGYRRCCIQCVRANILLNMYDWLIATEKMRQLYETNMG